MSSENPTRARRSTLECFNEELSVLDKPLESDVEYYDDPPPPSPWRWAGGVAGVAVLLGVAAGFLLTRQPSVALASAERPLPQLPVAAIQAVAPVAMPAAPEAPAPATTAIEPSAPSTAEEPATDERSVRQAPASTAAWAKLARRQARQTRRR